MFSLQKLLGKEDKFFTLLEASAEQGRTSAQALSKLCRGEVQPQALEEFAQARRKDKKITEEISEYLVTSFVTALEREDIEALSNSLYKIPKTIEKFAEHYLIAAPYLSGIDFSKQAGMLDEATSTIVQMVKKLRNIAHIEEVKDLNIKLQRVEGEADKYMLELLRELYKTNDGMKIVIAKDLYELLEKVVDRCRDAGNVVSQIILKNS
jgi:uncharacterized protein Yka (UPF0111/DUF47 family)